MIGCTSDYRLFRKIGQLVTAILLRKDKKVRTKAQLCIDMRKIYVMDVLLFSVKGSISRKN